MEIQLPHLQVQHLANIIHALARMHTTHNFHQQQQQQQRKRHAQAVGQAQQQGQQQGKRQEQEQRVAALLPPNGSEPADKQAGGAKQANTFLRPSMAWMRAFLEQVRTAFNAKAVRRVATVHNPELSESGSAPR